MRTFMLAFLVAVALGSATQPVLAQQSTLTESRLHGIAEYALTSTARYDVSYDIAAALGILPIGAPAGAALSTQQIHFTARDGTLHAFAIAGQSWQRVLFVIQQSGARFLIFAVDRHAQLKVAARLDNGILSLMEISDPEVRANFQQEMTRWANAIPAPRN